MLSEGKGRRVPAREMDIWLQCCRLHVPLSCGFHTDPKAVAVSFPAGIVMLALPCKSH